MQSIADFIKAAITLTLALGPDPEVDDIKPDHFLRGEGHGSFVAGLGTHQETADWLLGLTWEEVTEATAQAGSSFGKCRYFQAAVPGGTEAYTNVIPLDQLTEVLASMVRLRRGLHGDLEMYIPGLTPQPTTYVVLAVGNLHNPFEDPVAINNAVVYTWHPGPPAPRLNQKCVVKG